MALVLGTGFPVANVLLESSPTPAPHDLPRRKDAILSMMKELYSSLPGFKPMFFFSDKDSAQLKAIKDVYGLNPSLCLWHMKRAIKQKLGALRKEKKSNLSLEDEATLNSLLTDHFNRHPFFDKNLKDVPSCMITAANELSEFVQDRHENDLEQYLMVNW